MVIKFSQLYENTRHALLETETPQEAGLLARRLLAHASGKTQEQLLLSMEQYAQDDICSKLEELTRRALSGEPLAYILGEWDFYGMTLFVDPNVLIPRDDTCAVAELAIRQAMFLDETPRILDLCTGSGCIGLAVAGKVRDAKVTLGDISKEALSVAKKNIARQKLGGRVSCIQVDALQAPPAFLGKFDMIVSNPPYITSEEMTSLPNSVKNFEPHLALHGGNDGLEFYRSIIKHYTQALKPGGYLCFEFGMGQGNDICELLTNYGYTILERSKDFNQIERAVLAQYHRKEA